MADIVEAKAPFRFYTRLHLSELTGLRASTLPQLCEFIKSVPGSCIYYHTHRFLQQHQYLSPEPPNDFAYWVAEVLGERELGERLASIDTVQFFTIRSLREKIITTIEDYLQKRSLHDLRNARAGEEFHFIKCVSFVMPTEHEAHNLKEFASILEKITIDSLYYHIFESRLRLERPVNDLSRWLEEAVGDKELAARIATLDPYTYTLEDLRKKLVGIVEGKISG